MDALTGVGSMFEFGIVGGLLIILFEVVKIVGAMARVKLNGKASPEFPPPGVSPCERAVEKLTTVMEGYVGEDRSAHAELLRSVATQGKQVDELYKAHLGPGAIDPKTGSPRWWGHG